MKRLGLFVLLVGCASTATKDSASTAKNDADASRGSPVDAAVATVADAAASSVPERVTAFYPVVQGACAPARPVRIGTTPVLHFAKAGWALPVDGPAKLIAQQPPPYYSKFVGTMVGDDWRLAVLGGSDLDHVWFTTGSFSGRGEDQTYLTFAGKKLETPHGAHGEYGIQHVIQQPDGSIWAYGHHGMYLDIPGDEKLPHGDDVPAWRYNRWFAWSKDGAAQDINLPMGDMELAQRLDSGELVAVGVTDKGAAQLRRWSPARKVNDFTLKESVKASPELRVGKTRAVLKLKDQPVFYTYDGADSFKVAPVSAKASAPTSWLVTQDDELWVSTRDTIYIEKKDGTIVTEAMPEDGGRLALEPTTPWIMGKAGAVYERLPSGGWHKLGLPGGPWTEAQAPQNQIEWIAALGSETWVGTVRTDRGFGFKNPTQVRTFFASKPRAPLRCGSPFEASMLAPLPPRPDASCKDFLVLLGRERGRDGKVAIPYAKIAAAVKGDAALGATLTLGVFGSGGAYALRASTREIADTLVKKLAHVTAHEPEIVCGTAPAFTETRAATLDVNAGAFTSIPDAGAP